MFPFGDIGLHCRSNLIAPPVMTDVATVAIILVAIAIFVMAAGIAKPFAVGVVEIQNLPLVIPVAVVAAINSAVEPVTPIFIVLVPGTGFSVIVVVHIGTNFRTSTVPVTVNIATVPIAPSPAAPVNVIVLLVLYEGEDGILYFGPKSLSVIF